MKWSNLGHIFQKPKNANFNICFFAFFSLKMLKMKMNHPKLLFNIIFLWIKTKLEQLTPIF